MLRISVVNTPGVTQLKLEGKLAHEWVQEAAKAWTTVTGMHGDTTLVVDLFGVSFVDDAGHELLAAIRRAGAELLGCGPMMSALIEEIERSEVEHGDLDWDVLELDHDRKELKK